MDSPGGMWRCKFELYSRNAVDVTKLASSVVDYVDFDVSLGGFAGLVVDSTSCIYTIPIRKI